MAKGKPSTTPAAAAPAPVEPGEEPAVQYQENTQYNYDTSTNAVANSSYFDEDTDPLRDDPDGHFLTEKTIAQHKARVYYGDRPGFAEASLLMFLMVYGALLLYTGPMSWHNGCKRPLAIWTIVAGFLIMIVALTYFYVRNRYLWDRKRDRPNTIAIGFIACLAVVLFIWGSVGIVWTFESLGCQNTKEGAVIFYWCLITACFFMLMWLVALLLLLYLVLTKGTGKVWKAIVSVANFMNKPYSRVPIYILMIIVGIVLIALAARSWNVDDCDQPLTPWILCLGILFLVGGIICIAIDCIIWFARAGGPGKAIKGAFKKKAPQDDDEDEEEEDVDEDAYFTASRKSKKSRHLMKLLLIVYLIFTMLFLAGIVGIFFILSTESPCKGFDVFLDAKIAIILWALVMFVIFLYLLVLYGILPSLLRHKKEIRGLKKNKAITLADLIPFFFAVVMIFFAIVCIFMGGYQWRTDCDRPFAKFHTSYGVTLVVMCLLVMLLSQWGQVPSKTRDVGFGVFRGFFMVLIFWFFVLGCWGIFWFADNTCPDAVTNFYSGELSTWVMIVIMTGFWVLWSTYVKMKKKKQLKAEGLYQEDDDVFDEVDEDEKPHFSKASEILFAFWLFVTVFCLAGVYASGHTWDFQCDEPLREFVLVFCIIGAIAAILMIMRVIIVTFHRNTKKLLVRLVCDIPAISLLVFNCIWGLTGMVWFFKADTCVDTNNTIYAWTFFALMLFLLIMGLGVLLLFWKLSSMSAKAEKMGDEGDEEIAALKKNKYIRIASVLWAVFLCALWAILCIVFSSIDMNTTCDKDNLPIFVMVFGNVLLIMAITTMILKIFEITRPGDKSKIKVIKLPLMIVAGLMLLFSTYGLFLVWSTEDCYQKMPDTYNMATMSVIFAYCFAFLVLCTVFLRALTPRETEENWVPESGETNKKLTWDFRHQALEASLPMTVASYVNYTFLGGVMVFCTAYAAEDFHEKCDEPIRTWLVVAGLVGMIYVFMVFLKDCQEVLAGPSKEKQFTGPIIRGLLMFALFVWGVTGMVFFIKTHDCKEKAPGLYDALLAMMVVFVLYCLYAVITVVTFCLNPAKMFKNTTFGTKKVPENQTFE